MQYVLCGVIEERTRNLFCVNVRRLLVHQQKYILPYFTGNLNMEIKQYIVPRPVGRNQHPAKGVHALLNFQLEARTG